MTDGEFVDGFTLHNIEDYDAEPDSTYGKLLPPYGGIEKCAISTCQKELSEEETEGAFMFRDIESGKVVVICGKCAPSIELNHSDRFLLIPL